MAIVEFNNSQHSVICQISIIYCARVGLQQFLVSAEYNIIYCVYAPFCPKSVYRNCFAAYCGRSVR